MSGPIRVVGLMGSFAEVSIRRESPRPPPDDLSPHYNWAFVAFLRVDHPRHLVNWGAFDRLYADLHFGESPTKVMQMTSTIAVLYDDGCPLCTFQMRLLTWLDWKQRLRLVPISHPEASKLAPGLSKEQALESIHCVGPDGTIHRGARALRFVGMRLPMMIPCALFLWIPGVIYIAERVYMWISRNRHLLSRVFGCQGACAVMPKKSGRQDEELSSKPKAEAVGGQS